MTRLGEPHHRHKLEFQQAVTITYFDDDKVWDCYFIVDAVGAHEHAAFESKDDAIAWGRSKCPQVLLWRPDLERSIPV